jgi:hypothetical protein
MSSVKSPGVSHPSWALLSPREQIVEIWLENGRDEKVRELESLIAKAGGEAQLLQRVRKKYQPAVAELNARISSNVSLLPAPSAGDYMYTPSFDDDVAAGCPRGQ